MATISKKTTTESVLLNIDKISQSVGQEELQIFVDAIGDEIGRHELDKKEVEQLQELMNVDALEAAKWKSVADVLQYISVFALAEKNPETVRKTMEILLSILGLFFPIANTAQGVLTKAPDKLFYALVKIGGFVSPEYLIYRGVSMVANKKTERAKTQAENDAEAHENLTTLIIVCKNKLLSTEMDKLIQAKDDIDDEAIVGVKDGTVHTIIWNESAWEAFRDKLTNDIKVVIIGKIKNTVPLTAEKIRFNQYGVQYGWNNNIAMIEADPKSLSGSKQYNELLSIINDMQVSDKLKKNAKFKFDWSALGKLAIFPPFLIGDAIREGMAVKEQQLLFGLYTFYMQDMNEFIN